MIAEPVMSAFAQALLAMVFLAGGLAKLREREAFLGVVYNYRLLPESLVAPVAWLLPAAEVAVGAALLAASTRYYGALGAALLLAVFTAAIAVNLARGRRHIDCGCFSAALRQSLSGWLVLRNLALLGLAAWLTGDRAIAAAGSPPWLVGAAAAGLAVLMYAGAVTLSAAAEHAARRSLRNGS